MRRILLLLAASIFLFAGCSMLVEENKTVYELPDREEMIGMEEPERTIKPALYFLDPSTGNLVAETRQITVESEESIARQIIEELLKGPQSTSLAEVGKNLTFDAIELTEEVANVYLNKSESVDERRAYILGSALANTLADYFGVEYTVLFINGVAQGVGPVLSPFKKTTTSVTARYDQLYAQANLSEEERKSKTYETEAILYFIDETGQYLLPEVRTIRYTEDTFAQVLMNELAQGPVNKAYVSASVNKEIQSAGQLDMTLDEETSVLNIRFNVQPYVYTGSGSNGEALSAAAMTYTITGMLPVRGIEIEVADAKPASCYRTNYMKYIGERITLNFPDKNTTMLTQVQRTVSQESARMLRTKLEELIRGPIETDSADVWPAFPEGITTEDILGLALNGDVAVINFSQNFRERVKAMTPNNEAMMVYSIINTLTESEGIMRVQFLFEGEHVDELSGGIYYRHPLMANPGLLRK